MSGKNYLLQYAVTVSFAFGLDIILEGEINRIPGNDKDRQVINEYLIFQIHSFHYLNYYHVYIAYKLFRLDHLEMIITS
jgi:predicted RNA-binding protein with PUA domain